MMHTRPLLDPELAAVIDALPVSTLSLETLAATRDLVAQQVQLLRAATPPFPDIELSEHHTPPRADGSPAVRLLFYRPRGNATGAGAPLPALLWIHGGGYLVGNPECDDLLVKTLVRQVGCCVASVDYRLAPETRHPGPVEDCYAALGWLQRESAELGVDARRIGIAGLSAGGGLAAALGLLARDRGEYPLCLQALLQPMLDDRTATRAQPHPTAGEFIWTREFNAVGWQALLGHAPGADGVSPYAAAARANDLAGLPPSYLSVGALDLFIDESIEYARRLIHAGVPTELHVHPGACHGFQLLAPAATVSRAHDQMLFAALRRGLGVAAA